MLWRPATPKDARTTLASGAVGDRLGQRARRTGPAAQPNRRLRPIRRARAAAVAACARDVKAQRRRVQRARCAASTASAAAKQRSWRPLSFALSLAFDVRAGREHRLLPMASARNLFSHSRREFWASLAGEERLPEVVSGLVLLVNTSGARCGQQPAGKGCTTHPDPQICHRKPPQTHRCAASPYFREFHKSKTVESSLSHQPRDRPVLLAIQRRTSRTRRRGRTRRRRWRKTRRRTKRRTTTRRTTSEPELAELPSQRHGQPPSWRVQPARASQLLLYRNGTRGLLRDCDRFVCDSVLRGIRRAKLGRRWGTQVAPSRAARLLFCVVRGQRPVRSFSRPRAPNEVATFICVTSRACYALAGPFVGERHGLRTAV